MLQSKSRACLIDRRRIFGARPVGEERRMGERKLIGWALYGGGWGCGNGRMSHWGNGVGQGGEDVDSEWNVRGLVLDSSRLGGLSARSLGMRQERGIGVTGSARVKGVLVERGGRPASRPYKGWGEGKFLRPFDSAHASAHLRQGERNSPPLDSRSRSGMTGCKEGGVEFRYIRDSWRENAEDRDSGPGFRVGAA